MRHSVLASTLLFVPVLAVLASCGGSSSDANAAEAPSGTAQSMPPIASSSASSSSSGMTSSSSSMAQTSSSSSSSSSVPVVGSGGSSSSSSSSASSASNSAALPSYTVIDLGPDAIPATTSFGQGGCEMSTPPFGPATGRGLYSCHSLDVESSDTLENTMVWVGYQSGSSSNTDTPLIYASGCCGQYGSPAFGPTWPPVNGNGNPTPLPLPSGATGARALSLDSAAADAVGYAELSNGGERAVEWDAAGVALLPDVSGSAGNDSTAYAANACGQIVGESGQQFLTPGWGAPLATIWINGTPHELQQLLAQGAPSLSLTSARWINDSGEIGAIGFAAGMDASSTLNEHEYVLIPSPAPAPANGVGCAQ